MTDATESKKTATLPQAEGTRSGSVTGQRRMRYRPRVASIVDVQDSDTVVGSRPGAEIIVDSGPRNRLALRVSLAALAVVMVAMLLVLVAARVNLAEALSAFSVRFLSLFIEAAPFLLLGTVVAGLIDAFVRQDHILRFVPRNQVLGVLMGTFAGFLFPVCECGVVPVVRQLYSKKLPLAVGVAFLLGAPVMNPIVLFSTWAAFGWGPVLIGRYIISAVVAIAAGLFFTFSKNKLELRTVDAAATLPTPPTPPLPGAHLATLPEDVRGYSTVSKLRQALLVAGDEFFEMGRFLVIGALLAAAMQTLISQDVLLALGQGPVISVVVMQVLAFVLSVCSTVDAWLALAFTGAFTTGSLLTFLTFGPMVDIKSTIMYSAVFKVRTVAFIVGLPLMLTLAVGVILNLMGL